MLKNVALLLAVLLADAAQHEVYGQPLTEERRELSDEEIQRLRAAFTLSEAGYPKAALDVMGPMTEDLAVPWEVRSLIGELWEKTGDFGNAARFYQSIVDELGPRVGELPGNLHLRLGTVAFKIGDYQRAIFSLIQGLRYPEYADDGRVYEMLADSYAQTGQPDFAARAMLLRAAADPKARMEVINITAAAWTADMSPLPELPQPELLRQILARPMAVMPPTESNFPLSTLSLKYSVALDGVGWSRAASRYREAAGELVFRSASALIDGENKDDEGLRELMRLSILPGYADLPLKVRAVGMQLEMQAHTNAARFSHAAAALKRLAESGAYEMANVIETAIELQRLAFTHISFDFGSGSPRSGDPRDFIDTGQLVTAAEVADGQIPTLSPEEQKQRAESPYARVSQSEDWAELGSAVVTAAAYPAVKRELLAVVTRLLRERDFELLVKFSLHMLASSFLDEKMRMV